MTNEDQELIDSVVLALMSDRDVNASALKVAKNPQDAKHCSRNVRALDLAIAALRAHDDLVVACEMAKSRPVNIDELIESGRIFHIDGEIWGTEIAVIEEALAAATRPTTEGG